jgi:hypothetical protein
MPLAMKQMTQVLRVGWVRGGPALPGLLAERKVHELNVIRVGPATIYAANHRGRVFDGTVHHYVTATRLVKRRDTPRKQRPHVTVLLS